MQIDRLRLFAALRGVPDEPRVRHLVGLPPELTGGEDHTAVLSTPSVLVIEQESESSVFLYRLTRDGEPCGDTWHQSVDDALSQATFEYGDAVGEWERIPIGAADSRTFVTSVVRNRGQAD
jgi:hypothetical protein